MSHYRTLLLDISTWDLVLDVSGNIAVASHPYQMAQDVASALRLFEGELWYDTTKGVPYWTTILGFAPPVSLLKAEFNEAALSVPEVVAAATFVGGVTDRLLTGQVQVKDSVGTTKVIGF